MAKRSSSLKNLENHHHRQHRMSTMATNKELHTDRINRNICNPNYKYQARQDHKDKWKLYKDYEAQTSVCVAPLPKTITKGDLLMFMGRFGRIQKSHMGQDFFLVKYDKREAVGVVLSRSDWLEKETLHVKRFGQKNTKNSGDHKDDNADANKTTQSTKTAKREKKPPPIVIDILNYKNKIKCVVEEVSEFDDEVTTLLEAIQLTELEIRTKYDCICSHLESVFRSVFPQCRLYRFGSTMAGLGFKNSDLDMYMYIGDIGSQMTHKADMSFQEQAQVILRKLKKIMYSRSTVFSNIIAIPKARTPVIKFCYVPTGVSCDITFKNCFGIYKTNFLKFCASYDVRVKQLMLVIKYWAKEYKITGAGKMPNYGLMCLIIFYLQTVDILPTLIELRQKCIPQFVGDWQINFNEDYKRTAVPAGNQSVMDLLYGFFQFIKEIFPTSKQYYGVLSLLDGITYDKVAFNEVNSLPEYMGSYKYHILQDNGCKFETRHPVGIQDPIELNQNAIISASEVMLLDFYQHCYSALKCIENAKEKSCRNLLKDLLERSFPPPPPLKAKHRMPIGRFQNIGLPVDFDCRTDVPNKKEYKMNNWYFIVFNLIKDVLEMVFKFTVNVYLGDGTCVGELDVLPDTLIQKHEELHFHCVSHLCLWQNRLKQNMVLLDVQLSHLEKEAIISDKMQELNAQNKQNNINLECQYTVIKASKLEAVDIKLSQQNNQEHFYDVRSTVYKWIPRIINRTLTHMLQYNKTYDQLYVHRRKEDS